MGDRANSYPEYSSLKYSGYEVATGRRFSTEQARKVLLDWIQAGEFMNSCILQWKWLSPNRRTWNMIDLILVNTAMLNCKTH